MMLLVDAGNTRIKWRIVETHTLMASGVVATVKAADLAEAWLPYRISDAWLSCVADASVRAALSTLLAVRNIAAHWLIPAREGHGLINRYVSPEKLGSDRYAALIAAAHLKLGNCVVVSVGTATTVDRLTCNGEFVGGIILPGPNLMRTALLTGTGQIEKCMQPESARPNLELVWDHSPRDTEGAVSTGIALAQAGAIKAMCESGAGIDEPLPLVILTGGARDQVRAGLQIELIEIEDLVLEGLAWIALESRSHAN